MGEIDISVLGVSGEGSLTGDTDPPPMLRAPSRVAGVVESSGVFDVAEAAATMCPLATPLTFDMPPGCCDCHVVLMAGSCGGLESMPEDLGRDGALEGVRGDWLSGEESSAARLCLSQQAGRQ